MKFLTLPLTKKREIEEQKHIPTSKTFLKLFTIFIIYNYLITILVITNYHFYHLWLVTDENLKKKIGVKF